MSHDVSRDNAEICVRRFVSKNFDFNSNDLLIDSNANFKEIYIKDCI